MPSCIQQLLDLSADIICEKELIKQITLAHFTVCYDTDVGPCAVLLQFSKQYALDCCLLSLKRFDFLCAFNV